jgi:hypothetical protein
MQWIRDQSIELCRQHKVRGHWSFPIGAHLLPFDRVFDLIFAFRLLISAKNFRVFYRLCGVISPKALS